MSPRAGVLGATGLLLLLCVVVIVTKLNTTGCVELHLPTYSEIFEEPNILFHDCSVTFSKKNMEAFMFRSKKICSDIS